MRLRTSVLFVSATATGWQYSSHRTVNRSARTTRQRLRMMVLVVPFLSSSPDERQDENDNVFGAMSKLPKLIVFDLDNTLWTPELYILRRRCRQMSGTNNGGNGYIPTANQDVRLFHGARTILQQIREYQSSNNQLTGGDSSTGSDINFGIASRTKSIHWALDLLQQFQIHDLFTYIEIFPADKKQHFHKLQQASGIAYNEMMFFDDARDGQFGNVMSVAELGVLSVHCPNGLQTIDLLRIALLHYQNEWDGSSNTIIESDGTVTCATKCDDQK